MTSRIALLSAAVPLFAALALLACDKAPAGQDRAPLPLKKPLVVQASEVPQRVAPNGKGRITQLAMGNHAFVGVLQMDAGGAVPTHRDASEEFIYILEGSGTLTIDGRAYEVGPGTSIFMPAQAEVSYVNGDTPLKALQVFADPASSKKYASWKLADPAPTSGR